MVKIAAALCVIFSASLVSCQGYGHSSQQKGYRPQPTYETVYEPKGYKPTVTYEAPKYETKGYKQQETHYKPHPYQFGYQIKDDYGNQHSREEAGDAYGTVKGTYGIIDKHGIFRQVEYSADDYGFKAYIKTNEPGTANHSPADVHLEADPVIVQYEASKGYGKGSSSSGYGYKPKKETKTTSYAYAKGSSYSSERTYPSETVHQETGYQSQYQ